MTSDEHVETAKDLLDILAPSDKWVNKSSWVSPWIYRGQKDANWGLIPSAWRNGNSAQLQRLSKLKQIYKSTQEHRILELIASNPKIQTNPEFIVEAYVQARAEISLILEFVKLANDLGHPIHGMETYLPYEHNTGANYINIHSYPDFRFLPDHSTATTLAQHHGIPTRLLDWTRNPFVAAYFAASEVDPEESGNIAIWALNVDALKDREISKLEDDNKNFFYAYSPPYAHNRFMHAQSGVFMHPVYGCARYSKLGRWPDLEEFALSACGILNQTIIRKLTLPYSQVGELLRLLWLQGISRAHLMPTLDGVSHALVSRWRWQ